MNKVRNFRLTSIRLRLVVLAIALTSMSTPSAFAQASPIHVVFDVQGDFTTLSSPCAPENIRITGTDHVEATVVQNATRGISVQVNDTLTDLTATGLLSHATYRVVGDGPSHDVVSSTTDSATVTTVENLIVVGPGPDNNILLQLVSQKTVNANGHITVDRGDVKFVCR